MAEPQDWFSANAPAAPPAPAASGADWFGANAPAANFSTTNEKDAEGNAVVAGVSKAWDWANTPLVPQIAEAAHAIAGHIDSPKLDQSKTLAQIKGFLAGSTEAAGNVAAGFTSPVGLALTLAGLGEESAVAKSVPALKSLLALPAVQKLQKAVQAVGGAGFMAHGAGQVVNAPDAAGKLQGVAEMASGALGATSALRTGSPPAFAESRLTLPEQASNAFAADRGIPLDAATATGSKFVRGIQKVSGESLLGSPTAERAQQAQAAGLTRVGGELADQAHPSAITREGAGQAVRDALTQKVQAHASDAQTAYDAVEKAAQQRGILVSVGTPQKMLTPLYNSLKREAELVPLMGDKAKALTALDRLMSANGPVPLMDAENALSTLKGMSRLKDGQLDAMRTPGQGAAAVAVKELQKAVDSAAIQGGVLGDLKRGRASTVAKYETNGVLESLHGGEPVSAFKQLTRPKDESIGLLRSVTKETPQIAPQIARGYLEDLLGQATERGRFDHADKLYAEWQKLGGETKAVLFPQPGQRQALDHFFLLAKRIAENPNSSGTAPTLVKTGEAVGLLTHPLATLPPTLSMGAMAKLLYSPRGVRALTRFMSSVPKAASSPATLRSAAQTAGWAEVVAAARAAGVPLGAPAAAGNTTTGAPER